MASKAAATALAVWLGLGAAALPATADEPLETVVSILPQQEILQRVGGEAVRITVLIPPGGSPATFEPSPRLLAAVSGADIVFPIRLPFERTVVAKIAALDPDLTFCRAAPVSTASGPTDHAISDDQADGTVHDHHHGGLDPHFWLDPQQAITYAREVSRCLCDLRPEQCPSFQANLAVYTDELEAVDQRIETRLAPFAGRSIVVFHPAFGHFARRYQLRQVAVEVEGKNPTGRALAEIIDLARSQNVGTIFVQPQFAGTGAASVASAVGADLVPLDPLSADLAANLERIAERIADRLERE